MNISIAGIIFYLLTINFIAAQDVHWSMFHFNRLQISPGLTGVFNGDKQVNVFHKQQYYSVPVDFLTFSGSYDVKFNKCYNEKGYFSAGILFNYDQSGDSKLALANLTVNGSYTLPLRHNMFLTGGAYVGGGQRSFSGQDLEWENQWNGSVFDPTLPSGENFSRTGFAFLDVGAGANFRIQGVERTKLDVGAGGFHLNRPNYGFYENSDIKLPIRLSYYAMGVVKLADIIDVFGNAMYQDQGPYAETVLTGGVIIHLSTRKARELQVHLGAGGRLEDAWVPLIVFGYDGWKAGFSYDLTTSRIKEATDGNSGPEFFVSYTFKKLCPLRQTKVCTIF